VRFILRRFNYAYRLLVAQYTLICGHAEIVYNIEGIGMNIFNNHNGCCFFTQSPLFEQSMMADEGELMTPL
jgi:hypothetical protein